VNIPLGPRLPGNLNSERPGGIGAGNPGPPPRGDGRLPIGSCSRWGLPCRPSHLGRGALLPHRFTLTPANRGGFFSVALSCDSRRLVVNQHPALWSSDFPPAPAPFGVGASVHPGHSGKRRSSRWPGPLPRVVPVFTRAGRPDARRWPGCSWHRLPGSPRVGGAAGGGAGRGRAGRGLLRRGDARWRSSPGSAPQADG
jgi:hypothetical protein